ncbi:MAG: IclR family transcriptional regulator C-terminal domain-containing protein [Corynebacterium sp.]|uniref:IclR family transcriptional regulator domain-containing protein n=1 Tax=Corynebacterium sp. TaxID=1720 RepID=UPI0026DF5488|nr:IclR family transcriptional regulator C-terminal domain-containing protein [Corynebacterium sp.]MDO5669957.1 IclR family transcriptional regulator C-terminal domain-containing protein [Corynebacterium sp.]
MASPETPNVQSLVRGLAVIRTFNADRPRQTLAQVAEATGLARATARRFLHTLVTVGYASTDGTEFWLTPRVLELGYSYMSGLGLPAIAQPRLEELSRHIGESSSLSVLDGHEVVYVNRVPVRRIMTVSITIGTRFPAYATSMGRVILAGLPADELERYLDTVEFEAFTPSTLTDAAALYTELSRTREQGFSIVDQELEPGLRSLAAPVHSPAGKVVAAVNVSTQTAVHDLEELHNRFLPALIDTAELITADLAATELF